MNRRDFLLAASAAAGGSAAASGTAAAQQGNGSGGGGGNASGGSGGNQSGGGNASAGGGGGGGGGGSTQTVTVGPGGQFVFDPDSLSISPGDAVEFVWESDNHNVSPTEGDWGHEPIENTGFSFTTPPFEETGTHEYVCVPHEAAGMTGTIEVGGGGGGETEQDPEEMGVPFQAHFVGIATILMIIVSLIYTFFVVKYGESPNTKGGD